MLRIEEQETQLVMLEHLCIGNKDLKCSLLQMQLNNEHPGENLKDAIPSPISRSPSVQQHAWASAWGKVQ